jgi:predicted aldo/keto reductase-like oxidoreductase
LAPLSSPAHGEPGLTHTAAEGVRITHAAIDADMTFLDNAWEDHEGESERRMGRAIPGRRSSS